ncbi:MAG: hypothetical protein ACKOYC_03700 [Bacteroidota bacterium]
MSDPNHSDSFNHIIKSLSDKAVAKLEVGENAAWAFGLFKSQLRKLESEITDAASAIDKRIGVKFVERGPLDLEFRVSDDIIIFSLHTDAFTFDESHPIWKHSGMRAEHGKGYFGMISIYNFLTDSIKFNRVNDQGVLVARVFIDRHRNFFMEGKKQLGLIFNSPGTEVFADSSARRISETIIAHCLDFDIITPAFDQVRIISVQEMIEKSLSSVVSTGKRLGFRLQTDDDLT